MYINYGGTCLLPPSLNKQVQWNLSYPDPTYPDSRLTELWK